MFKTINHKTVMKTLGYNLKLTNYLRETCVKKWKLNVITQHYNFKQAQAELSVCFT